MLERKLKEYSRSGVYPFHMPGHKRQLDFPNPYSLDITEIEGFDNLHHAKGILAEAQERAARLYGADRSYYLVNGSTCGILAAVSAAVPKGASVLVARNCHKSVYHALELRDAKPIYLYPRRTDVGIAGQIQPGEIEELLRREQDVRETGNLLEAEKPHETGKVPYRIEDLSAEADNGRRGQSGGIAAVIITSPTYDGVVSDIREIAEIVHRYGVPLLVDAAHGAHFGFSECFPENPLRLGADAVVVSIHKTLPAFTQTALLHLKGERISAERVEEFLDIFETSSPSYVLMAGADRCMQIMASDGKRLLNRLAARLEAFYERMGSLRQMYVLRKSNIVGDSFSQAYDFDESKILIFTDRAGISGMQLADILRTEYGLEMEMACANYVLALATLMDTEEGFIRLGDALLAIDASLEAISKTHGGRGYAGVALHTGSYADGRMDAVMPIAEAREAGRRRIPLEQAAGSVSASYLIPYPPGIPLVVPGERIDAQTATEISHCRRMGITVEGLIQDDMVMVVK